MAAHGRKNVDTALLLALARGLSVRAAAKRACCGERTVYRRLKDEGFAKQLADLKAELVKRTTTKLAAMGIRATNTLNALMAEGIRPEVRLGAARSVLEIGCKWREVGELAERIAQLEADVEAVEEARGGNAWGA